MWIAVVGAIAAIVVAIVGQFEALRPDVARSKRLLRDLEIRDKLDPGGARTAMDSAIELGVRDMLDARSAMQRRIGLGLVLTAWIVVGTVLVGVAFVALRNADRADVDVTGIAAIAALVGGVLASGFAALDSYRNLRAARRSAKLNEQLELSSAFVAWAESQGATVEREVQGPGRYRFDMRVRWPDGSVALVEVFGHNTPTSKIEASAEHFAVLAGTTSERLLVVTPEGVAKGLAGHVSAKRIEYWTTGDGMTFYRPGWTD